LLFCLLVRHFVIRLLSVGVGSFLPVITVGQVHCSLSGLPSSGLLGSLVVACLVVASFGCQLLVGVACCQLSIVSFVCHWLVACRHWLLPVVSLPSVGCLWLAATVVWVVGMFAVGSVCAASSLLVVIRRCHCLSLVVIVYCHAVVTALPSPPGYCRRSGAQASLSLAAVVAGGGSARWRLVALPVCARLALSLAPSGGAVGGARRLSASSFVVCLTCRRRSLHPISRTLSLSLLQLLLLTLQFDAQVSRLHP
jgi:hypothetical protein